MGNENDRYWKYFGMSLEDEEQSAMEMIDEHSTIIVERSDKYSFVFFWVIPTFMLSGVYSTFHK